MKASINGKIYSTETMIELVNKTAYCNGNYSGDTSIRKTPSGLYAIVVTSNGQDLYRCAHIRAVTKDKIASFIDGWSLTEGETAALLAEGILTEA